MTDPLARRAIGRTGVQVTRFGFGGTVLGGRHVYSDVDEAQALAAVRSAYRAGIRYFDTAPFYGSGIGESRMGAALDGLPRDRTLSTKVGYLVRGSGHEVHDRPGIGVVRDYSAAATRKGLEESLERLRVERIDIVYIHDVDKGGFFEAAMRRTYPVLERMRAEGSIGAIGVGVGSWELCLACARRGDFDCFMLAGRYTLLEQAGALHELLPFCAEAGIGVIVAAPFNSGILASGPVAGARYDYAAAPPAILDKVAPIRAVCARYGVPLPAAALQFPLAHPAVTGMVVGSRNAAELRANLAACRLSVPAGLCDELKAAGLLDPAAPVPAGA